MANTLARMERDGLITRRRHPNDKRSQQILLTDRARGIEAAAKEAALAISPLRMGPDARIHAHAARQHCAQRRRFLIPRIDNLPLHQKILLKATGIRL
ncbi:MarR family transcriptional regulator [Sinorhizobium sp. 8-89]|nr:MarR family transcriptional regulator [Sinorhizobium sp. 7-81]